MIMDQGYKSGKNIQYISVISGFERETIMSFSPATVANEIKYSPVREDCLGKVSFVKELLKVLYDELELSNFTREDMKDILRLTTTD